MKLSNMITTLSLFVSLTVNAQEICRVGYNCENSDGDFILRHTQLVQDENIMLCQTVTITNFKKDEDSCIAAANKLNNEVAIR